MHVNASDDTLVIDMTDIMVIVIGAQLKKELTFGVYIINTWRNQIYN